MLKNKRDIRWKDAIGGNRYSGNDAEKSTSIITETALVSVCMLIFLLSARIMLDDVFTWAEFSGVSVALSFIMLTIVAGIMEFSYHMDKRQGLYIRWGVLLVGIVIACMYLWLDGDDSISVGVGQAMEQFMKHWNLYYNGNKYVPGGDTWHIQSALNFIYFIFTFVFLWISRMTKKNIVMLTGPIVVFCLELLVGYSPKEIGIFLMFLGIVIANASKWTKSDFVHSFAHKRFNTTPLKNCMWLVVGAGAICFYGIVKLFGSSYTEDMSGKAREFKEFQEDFINDVSNWSVWEAFGAVSDSGILTGDWTNNDSYKDKLSNKPLKYEGKTVLTVKTDQRLSKNIYIRGYYANIYDDGIWELDTDAFEEACKSAGYDVEEMGDNILTLGASKLFKRGIGAIEAAAWFNVTVEYKNPDNERAFFPYFVSITDKENIFIEGDGRYRKNDDTENLKFYVWNREPLYKYYIYQFDNVSRNDWEDWYEDFVMEQYTKISDNMPAVKDVAEIIKTMTNSDTGYINVNERRLGVADSLVKWFRQNTEYTKTPQALPYGEDPVEYFLSTSKEGYCMHYASSAVLILRTLGVPARYATGYVVDADLFRRSSSVYVAEVPDNRAHAWVEIYLDGVGWVPVEVTNGYENTDLDNIGEEESSSTEEPTTEEIPSESTTLPEEDTSGEETTSNQEETTQNKNEEQTSESEIEGGIGLGNGDEEGTGNSKSFAGIFKTIFICLLFVAAGGGIGYFIMKKKVLYNELLTSEIKRKRTVHAIKRINRRIYRKLRIQGKVFKSNLRDDEYVEILKKTYPDITEKEWGRYIVVVKAATFSNIDLAEKEMDFCYDIYKKVMRKTT